MQYFFVIMASSGWYPNVRIEYKTIHIDDLEISFQRTLRVPDNNESSALPPGMGKLPLYHVKDHASKLPPSMKAKGGLFLPMYRTLLRYC